MNHIPKIVSGFTFLKSQPEQQLNLSAEIQELNELSIKVDKVVNGLEELKDLIRSQMRNASSLTPVICVVDSNITSEPSRKKEDTHHQAIWRQWETEDHEPEYKQLDDSDSLRQYLLGLQGQGSSFITGDQVCISLLLWLLLVVTMTINQLKKYCKNSENDEEYSDVNVSKKQKTFTMVRQLCLL